ncbi:MAG: ribosomal RNA small subunit methyltransferase A, partial [Lachnospiraceae bacterium]
TLIEEENAGRPVKVAANLPYYITTPILMQLFESGAPLTSITVMVQKEVADRMAASPGTKDYGALSLAVQYRARPETACIASAGAFLPPPKVDSAVVHMSCYEKPPVETKDPKKLFALIHAAFAQRRKTLANALSGAPGLHLSKEEANALIETAGFPANVRGERLSLSDYARLANLMDHGS